MHNKLLHALSIFLVCFIHTSAQEIFIERLDQNDGLPSLEINDITQTSDGRMWIAHGNGVSSFDGIRFTTYNFKDGLRQAYQNKLCISHSDTLFSLSANNEVCISKFHNNSWVEINQTTDIPSSYRITGFEIVNMQGEEMIFVSDKQTGIYYYDSDWHYISTDELGCKQVNSLVAFQNAILIGTDKGFREFSDGTITQTTNSFIPDTNRDIKAFYIADDNSLIFLMGKSICTLVSGTFKKIGTLNSNIIMDGEFSDIHISENVFGDIIIGDATQLYKIEKNPFRIMVIEYDFSVTTEGVSCLYEDDYKNTWVGTYRGISIFRPSIIKNYDKKNGLTENEVTSIIRISDGEYILGHNMGISFFDGNKTLSYLPLSESTNFNIKTRVLDITTDYDGTTWFASSHIGFGVIKNKKISWINDKNFSETKLYHSILYDTINQRLWCSMNNGTGYFDKNNIFHRIPEIKGVSRKIFKLSDGRIYFATIKDGIYYIGENDSITHIINTHKGKEENNIFSIFLDEKNILWCGTNMGLRCYNNGIFYNNLEGLPQINSPIYQINSDNNNNIWIGTNNSVFRYNETRLLEYTQYEGYNSNETNRSAFGVDSNGNILIGGSGGLSIFNSQKINDWHSGSIPNCEITAIQVDSVSYSAFSNITLPYNTNTILLNFTPIVSSGRSSLVQQVMLAGLDNSWKTIDDRFVRTALYSNLPPGTYNFMYRVSNDDGRTWCRAAISDNIVIESPFWKKTYFIIIIMILIFTFGVLLFYVVTRSNYAKKLERDVQQRTSELENLNHEKDVFLSIIAHDLKSPFNAIIGFSEILKNEYDSFDEKEKKSFVTNIHEASENTFKLIEKLLDWSRANAGRIEFTPTIVDLSVVATLMIKTYRNAASKKDIIIKSLIGYHSKIYADQNLLETIFRNLISNAIKYTNPHGEIIINAEKQGDEYVAISISDNGIGIDKETLKTIFQINKKISTPGTHEETGTGLGLLVVKEFVEINGGTITVSSTPGKGSVFTFTVPSKDLS